MNKSLCVTRNAQTVKNYPEVGWRKILFWWVGLLNVPPYVPLNWIDRHWTPIKWALLPKWYRIRARLPWVARKTCQRLYLNRLNDVQAAFDDVEFALSAWEEGQAGVGRRFGSRIPTDSILLHARALKIQKVLEEIEGCLISRAVCINERIVRVSQ